MNKFVVFVLGALVGAFAYYYMTTEREFEEEVLIDYSEEGDVGVESVLEIKGGDQKVVELKKVYYTKSEDYIETPEAPEDDDPEIHLISFEEFDKGLMDDVEKYFYDKETLTFYDGDHVLVGENEQDIYSEDEQVEDSLRYFGEEAQKRYGDPDVLYVRNHNIQVDYEIIRVPHKYAEKVLGIYEEDCQ